MEQPSSIYWLVVEDDENEYLLFLRACRLVDRRPILIWLRNGLEAISYLSDPGKSVAAIVSDINMPRMSGLELLQWVKQHERHKATPFFMLSSSDVPDEIEQAFDWGVQDYQVKPHESRALVGIVEGWMRRCANGAPNSRPRN